MKAGILPLAAAAAGGVALGVLRTKEYRKKKEDKLRERVDILSDHFQLLNHWLEIKGEGKSAACYFREMGYFKIAIYGMAELASRLCEDLEGSGVEVVYGIDRDVSCTAARKVEVYSPEDDLPGADAVVVTPYFSFEEIQRMLSGKVRCPIVSLEEVIWSL